MNYSDDNISTSNNDETHQNRFIFSNDYYKDMPLESDNRFDVAKKVVPFNNEINDSSSFNKPYQANDINQLVQNDYTNFNTFDFFGHDINTKIEVDDKNVISTNDEEKLPIEDIKQDIKIKRETPKEDTFFSAIGNSILKKKQVVDENVIHIDKPEIIDSLNSVEKGIEMPIYQETPKQDEITSQIKNIEAVDTTGLDNTIIDNIIDYHNNIDPVKEETENQYVTDTNIESNINIIKPEKHIDYDFMNQNQKASNLSIDTGIDKELEHELIKQKEQEELEMEKNNSDLKDYLKYTSEDSGIETIYKAGGKSYTREKRTRPMEASSVNKAEQKQVDNSEKQPEIVNIDEKIDREPRNIQEMIEDILDVPNLSELVVPINRNENPGFQFGINKKEKEEVPEDVVTTVYDEKEDNFDYDQNFNNVEVKKSDLLDKLKEQADQDNKISILARYGEDFCSKDYVTNPAIGRKDEIKQLILILLTPEKSGILIGKPGIGKTSIVEGLAYQLQRDNVPDALKGYCIVSVKTASLLGTLPTGETRLQTLVDELKQLDKIILFIDEIHMLIGATNDSALDFANMFKESLGRGSIKVIGATTTEEYERYILRDKAFVRRFQKVEVEEPTREQTIKILLGTLPKIEKSTGAKLKYTQFIQSEIMAFIVDITTEYKRIYGIGSRYPDICLTLLAQAFSQAVFANRKEVTIIDIRKAIENSKNIYPDVIKKELINFDKKFKDIINEEEIK